VCFLLIQVLLCYSVFWVGFCLCFWFGLLGTGVFRWFFWCGYSPFLAAASCLLWVLFIRCFVLLELVFVRPVVCLVFLALFFLLGALVFLRFGIL
jgi:hypothetical protein